MGGKRNLVLGRCAALLFLCGAFASLPTNALLHSSAGAYWVNALALVSAIVTGLIPWDRMHRRWLHVLSLIASGEVTLAVIVHGDYATVFMWYFVLVAVFAAYAFRRRGEALAQLAVSGLCIVATSAYANGSDPDAVANAIVAIPTIFVAGGVVIWLRENLERRERTDPLTGLGNRRALMEALDEVVTCRAERMLVLFDLDGFKRYNDRLGHGAGDELLERLGAALNRAAAEDGEAFRLGGDEMCVLLSDSRALAACEAALHEDGISASHGSAWLPHEADTASGALSLADDRMYAAKRAARETPFVLAMEPGKATVSASATPSAREKRSGRSPASVPPAS